MPTFNVYLLGRWINEMLFLSPSGCLTLSDVHKVAYRDYTRPYPGVDYSSIIDPAFITVSFCRLDQERA